MQVNIQEAEKQLSKLLELVETGEPVIITRSSDDWWQPMANDEVDDWLSGR